MGGYVYWVTCQNTPFRVSPSSFWEWPWHSDWIRYNSHALGQQWGHAFEMRLCWSLMLPFFGLRSAFLTERLFDVAFKKESIKRPIKTNNTQPSFFFKKKKGLFDFAMQKLSQKTSLILIFPALTCPITDSLCIPEDTPVSPNTPRPLQYLHSFLPPMELNVHWVSAERPLETERGKGQSFYRKWKRMERLVLFRISCAHSWL